MYADRYAPRRVNRGSLGLSIGIVAPILAAALLTSPVVRHWVPRPPITLIDVLPPPPPPPPEPLPKPTTQVTPRTSIQPVRQIVPTPIPNTDPLVVTSDPAPLDLGNAVGPATEPTAEPVKPVEPVLVGPGIDDRYAALLQPAYPPAEQRAGRDGVVTLRVLVGIDGRVKQVEEVAATSDAFWQVTQRQALTRWRLKPATRDGIPTEGWKTMTVRFHLTDAG